MNSSASAARFRLPADASVRIPARTTAIAKRSMKPYLSATWNGLSATSFMRIRFRRFRLRPFRRKGKSLSSGGGPAGLTAATDLMLMGYGVTLFEAKPKLGGMLRYGIPAYRLPKDILDKEIQAIISLGVEVKTGTTVAAPKDLLRSDLQSSGSSAPAEGFHAVFVATGAWENRKLGIPGEDAQGVLDGLNFLCEANSGNAPEIGPNVLVLGSSDLALDAARTALRLPGVKSVRLACMESRSEMPAPAGAGCPGYRGRRGDSQWFKPDQNRSRRRTCFFLPNFAPAPACSTITGDLSDTILCLTIRRFLPSRPTRSSWLSGVRRTLPGSVWSHAPAEGFWRTWTLLQPASKAFSPEAMRHWVLRPWSKRSPRDTKRRNRSMRSSAALPVSEAPTLHRNAAAAKTNRAPLARNPMPDATLRNSVRMPQAEVAARLRGSVGNRPGIQS